MVLQEVENLIDKDIKLPHTIHVSAKFEVSQ